MNTFCEIEAEGRESIFLEEAVEESFEELWRIEQLFSRYDADAQISKINQNAHLFPLKVEDEVFQLLKRCLELSQKTQGAFDITIGTVIDFWRKAEERNILPSDDELKSVSSKIGWQNLVLDSNEKSVCFAKKGVLLDLGAIAKGYGLDMAAKRLTEIGVKSFQINLGGNILLKSENPQVIALRNPICPDEILTTVSLKDASISTSANYERFFTIENKKFGHLLNPLTGEPVDSDILSVSIICKDAALADCLSTALFVLGFKRGCQLLKNFQGVEAIIVCKGLFGRGLKILKMKGDN